MATSLSVICEVYFKSFNCHWVSVSNPTPAVSVAICDANDGAEFDTLRRQKAEMKEIRTSFDGKFQMVSDVLLAKVMRVTITSRNSG
jgi:hypothetical protein